MCAGVVVGVAVCVHAAHVHPWLCAFLTLVGCKDACTRESMCTCVHTVSTPSLVQC